MLGNVAVAFRKFHDLIQKGNVWQNVSGLIQSNEGDVEFSPSSVRGGAGSSCPVSSMDFVGDACGRID